MLEETIRVSSSLTEACESFLNELRDSMREHMAAYPDEPNAPVERETEGHDDCTFLVPWCVAIRHDNDGQALDYLRRARDLKAARFREQGLWHHGYWKKQEAHHGPEHYQYFLHALWLLAPEDAETAGQYRDAAEHIGNWVEGIPAWFDWDRMRFRSSWLGTEHIGDPGPNQPDHLRFCELSRQAFLATRDERFKGFALRYADEWVRAILESPDLPVALGTGGALGELTDEEMRAYRAFVGAGPKDVSDPVMRSENLIASGVPSLLIDLADLQPDARLIGAARRILEAGMSTFASPHAWQMHAGVRRFREKTGESCFASAIDAVPDNACRRITVLRMDPAPEERPEYRHAMGLRFDMPVWTDDNGAPAPSPLLLTTVALHRNDEALLMQAVDLGRTYFRLARQAYGNSTFHGCGSRSLSAVARGHGRLDGAGVVTEVLAPALGHMG